MPLKHMTKKQKKRGVSSRSQIKNSDCCKTPEHYEEQEVNPGKLDDYGAWIDGWTIGDKMP